MVISTQAKLSEPTALKRGDACNKGAVTGDILPEQYGQGHTMGGVAGGGIQGVGIHMGIKPQEAKIRRARFAYAAPCGHGDGMVTPQYNGEGTGLNGVIDKLLVVQKGRDVLRVKRLVRGVCKRVLRFQPVGVVVKRCINTRIRHDALNSGV
jgi:hypothetical protein